MNSSWPIARTSARRVSSVMSFWKYGSRRSVPASASSPLAPSSIQPPKPETLGEPSAGR